MQRNVDTRTSDYLYICDRPEDGCINCQACPCKDPHTEDDCEGMLHGCDECRMIDQFVVAEIEEEMHELYPILIMEKMPIDWGWGAGNATEFWSKQLLYRAEPSLLMEKFAQNYKNNFGGSRSTAKTIKFSRYPQKDWVLKDKVSYHMADALAYGTGILSHSYKGVFIDEAAEIPEGKVTGKNPHSETD